MLLLLLALVFVGCSKEPAPAPAPVSAPSAANENLTPVELHKQAMALLSQGKPAEAAPLLSALVLQQPTADNYSDLSYTLLLTRDWKAARAAAQKAIQLQPQHPGAYYNAGIAALELGDLEDAVYRLGASAHWQPDRYEPQMALARVYSKWRDVTYAEYYLQKALRLAPTAPEAVQVKAELAALRASAPAAAPPGYPGSCKALLTDGPLTLCIHGEKELTFYALDSTGKVKGSHAARIRNGHPQLTKTALSGGRTGYWLSATGAVFDELNNVLWVLRDGRPVPIIGTEMRSINAPPGIIGDHIQGSHHTPTRDGWVTQFYRLSPDLTHATFEGSQTTMKGK